MLDGDGKLTYLYPVRKQLLLSEEYERVRYGYVMKMESSLNSIDYADTFKVKRHSMSEVRETLSKAMESVTKFDGLSLNGRALASYAREFSVSLDAMETNYSAMLADLQDSVSDLDTKLGEYIDSVCKVASLLGDFASSLMQDGLKKAIVNTLDGPYEATEADVDILHTRLSSGKYTRGHLMELAMNEKGLRTAREVSSEIAQVAEHAKELATGNIEGLVTTRQRSSDLPDTLLDNLIQTVAPNMERMVSTRNVMRNIRQMHSAIGRYYSGVIMDFLQACARITPAYAAAYGESEILRRLDDIGIDMSVSTPNASVVVTTKKNNTAHMRTRGISFNVSGRNASVSVQGTEDGKLHANLSFGMENVPAVTASMPDMTPIPPSREEHTITVVPETPYMKYSQDVATWIYEAATSYDSSGANEIRFFGKPDERPLATAAEVQESLENSRKLMIYAALAQELSHFHSGNDDSEIRLEIGDYRVTVINEFLLYYLQNVIRDNELENYLQDVIRDNELESNRLGVSADKLERRLNGYILTNHDSIKRSRYSRITVGTLLNDPKIRENIAKRRSNAISSANAQLETKKFSIYLRFKTYFR